MSRYLVFFFFTIFLAKESLDSISFGQEDILGPGERQEWERLIHANGNEPGQVDGQLFYLSPTKTSDDEWRENLRLFRLPQEQLDLLKFGRFQQPIYCTFIARYFFFRRLNLIPVRPIEACTDYWPWKESLVGSDINQSQFFLSFSTAYPNNPASAFGHTFLRIQKFQQFDPLLDYTVAYSADIPPGENSVLYALKGLSGGYSGYFDITPFHQKIQEYNHSENRDLFEYPLLFTLEEKERLIAHLWELYSSAQFNYYFLDENCSAILAQLLMAARPQWDLNVHRWYYLPSDLAKRVAIEFPSTSIAYYPSSKKKWRKQFALLNSEQKKHYSQIWNNKSDMGENILMNSGDRAVLDLILLQLNIVQHQKRERFTEEWKAFQNHVLLARSKINGNSESQPTYFDLSHRPDLTSLPRQIILGGRFYKASDGIDEWVNQAQIKLGYHHALDAQLGHGPFEHFDYFGLTLSHFTTRNKLKITEVKGINIRSLYPIDSLEQQVSWSLGSDYTLALDTPCATCSYLSSHAGVGVTTSVLASQSEHLLWASFFAGAFNQLGDFLLKGVRAGPVLWSNLYFQWNPKLLAMLEAQVYQNVFFKEKKFYSISANLNQQLSESWAIRLEWRNVLNYGKFVGLNGHYAF